MPVNGMNVGSDYSISYYDTFTGALIDLGDVQNVKITAQKHDLKNMPYNKPPSFGYVPDGFKIDFTITRNGPVLEDLMVTFAERFQAGQINPSGYLNQTTINPDGSVSRYQYTKMVIFLENHGEISREKVVTLSLTGAASEKKKIA